MMPTRFPILIAALALAACSSLTGKKEPFTIYAPRYSAPAAASAAKVDWQLAIETPVASDALDSNRMFVMPTPGALETYKGGRWSDTAPMLLRGLVIQAFQDSGRIEGVGAAASALHADVSLAIDLYDFETQYRDDGPHALIRFNAKLTDLSLNRVRAARAFEADARVAGASAADAAAAMQASLAKALPELVEWTLAEGSKRDDAGTTPAG